METALHVPAFTLSFDAPQAELVQGSHGAELRLPIPWLAGETREGFGNAEKATIRWAEPLLLAEEPDLLSGAILVDASARLEDAAEQAFRQILDLTREWHLYRIWSYVPQINQIRGGLERYRQFNIGRWLAFESHFGRDFRSFMPGASAVGIRGEKLAILFKAGRSRPQYFENPSQLPAYHYPPEYGPRPPAFARGVVIDRGEVRTALLSGTASIEGHASVGMGDWEKQFRTTLHNIEIMLNQMEAQAALKPKEWAQAGVLEARFLCYLRHPEALPQVRAWVRQTLGTDRHFSYVNADICRNELDLEIEGFIRTSRCTNHVQ